MAPKAKARPEDRDNEQTNDRGRARDDYERQEHWDHRSGREDTWRNQPKYYPEYHIQRGPSGLS